MKKSGVYQGSKKNPRKVTKEKVTSFDVFGGQGQSTGTKKTVTKGDKTKIKTKRKFETGLKTKLIQKTNDPGAIVTNTKYDSTILPPDDAQGKYVIKSKRVGETETGKKIKKKKTIKETYVDGKEVKSTVKKSRTPATMKKAPTKQSKPDYIDIDGDGDKKESMKKAAAESPAKKMNHSMAYKADYDKDMAEERIKIKDAKEDIYEDDKEKRDSMATKKSFAMQFSEKSPMARFKDFDQMDSYDAKETAGESPAKQKMFGSESLYKENKSYEDAVKSYDDSTKAGYSPTYPKMSDHFHAIQPDKPKSKETMKKSPAPKHGAMKGDQSATHTDYANYKGTDKGYHGEDGSSHGDQSATKSDYRTRMTRNSKL